MADAYDRVAEQSRCNHTALARAWNNAAKNYLLQYTAQLTHLAPQSTLRVIELACGKGGELHKWNAIAASMDCTVDWRGADVSEASLRVAHQRFLQHRTAHMVGDDDRRFVCADVGSKLAKQDIEALTPDGPAHVVSMQMAFHYMWKSNDILHNWCSNVAEILQEGGVCVVTYFDAQAMLHGSTEQTQTEYSFLQGSTVVRFDGTQRAQDARTQSGVPYTFSMQGSVDDAVEYTVRVRELVRIARTHQLELLRIVRLIDLPVRHAKIDATQARRVLKGALDGSTHSARGAHADVSDMANFARFYRGLILVKRST